MIIELTTSQTNDVPKRELIKLIAILLKLNTKKIAGQNDKLQN